MSTDPLQPPAPQVNLGIYDGDVAHEAVNRSIAGADRAILFGEQTRLPHFPRDRRLPRLHAADPRVLFFWRVLKKVPPRLRAALVEGPVSITLVRGDALLHFEDVRCHQAVHIGRRRRTIYLPELLLQQAEEKGYNHWAIAEGIIYAAWMLLDYLLLVDILTAHGGRGAPGPTADGHAQGPRLRLSEPLLRRLVRQHNQHRRQHPEPERCEVEEFVRGYRSRLIRVPEVKVFTREPWEVARVLFDASVEQTWAQAKMERVADLYDYPRMFLFDRDIIHGAARVLAQGKGQSLAADSFLDALHDYRDELRFESHPPLTEFGHAIVPKPRAVFLRTVVELGLRGLRGFLQAYREGVPEAVDLIHLLWTYLVSLSSDPAGVYARFGRCRARCRPLSRRRGAEDQGLPEDLDDGLQALDGDLAGILVRLDGRPDYRRHAAEILALGGVAREELVAVIATHGLGEADEWATFKMRKQAIVSCACALLDRLDGTGGGPLGGGGPLTARRRVHEDEQVRRILADHPHRWTGDPSGVLFAMRAYTRNLARFGADDPDTNARLAAVLVRLDRHPDYQALLRHIPALGPPALSALYEVLDQVPDHDEQRGVILQRARQLLGRLLLEKRLRSRAAQRARRLASGPAEAQAATSGPTGDSFVGLRHELLSGTAFLQRGAPRPAAAAPEGPAC